MSWPHHLQSYPLFTCLSLSVQEIVLKGWLRRVLANTVTNRHSNTVDIAKALVSGKWSSQSHFIMKLERKCMGFVKSVKRKWIISSHQLGMFWAFLWSFHFPLVNDVNMLLELFRRKMQYVKSKDLKGLSLSPYNEWSFPFLSRILFKPDGQLTHLFPEKDSLGHSDRMNCSFSLGTYFNTDLVCHRFYFVSWNKLYIHFAH